MCEGVELPDDVFDGDTRQGRGRKEARVKGRHGWGAATLVRVLLMLLSGLFLDTLLSFCDGVRGSVRDRTRGPRRVCQARNKRVPPRSQDTQPRSSPLSPCPREQDRPRPHPRPSLLNFFFSHSRSCLQFKASVWRVVNDTATTTLPTPPPSRPPRSCSPAPHRVPAH